ncbi:uncharacterized protein BDZ99DRAFT_497714 [Mytilinidion resinicola]|uniref:Copper transporter n=1 Tax=Mytilinidion resinicola TaxID=574789 RepID=A0A6A6YRS2_9PEZI|nr:uncharacterized protein BDZ99DRAFT_497714 [Mytilinidion resinicola]KAF2810744.1 hypothetical protein BDZ99DRAFT_497714 [Mytilinidion resinicola]
MAIVGRKKGVVIAVFCLFALWPSFAATALQQQRPGKREKKAKSKNALAAATTASGERRDFNTTQPGAVFSDVHSEARHFSSNREQSRALSTIQTPLPRTPPTSSPETRQHPGKSYTYTRSRQGSHKARIHNARHAERLDFQPKTQWPSSRPRLFEQQKHVSEVPHSSDVLLLDQVKATSCELTIVTRDSCCLFSSLHVGNRCNGPLYAPRSPPPPPSVPALRPCLRLHPHPREPQTRRSSPRAHRRPVRRPRRSAVPEDPQSYPHQHQRKTPRSLRLLRSISLTKRTRPARRALSGIRALAALPRLPQSVSMILTYPDLEHTMLGSVSGILLVLFLSWLSFVTAREMWREARAAWKDGAMHSGTVRREAGRNGAVAGWYYIAGGGKGDRDEEEIDVKDTCCVQ